jgi:hypothetical protein
LSNELTIINKKAKWSCAVILSTEGASALGVGSRILNQLLLASRQREIQSSNRPSGRPTLAGIFGVCANFLAV